MINIKNTLLYRFVNNIKMLFKFLKYAEIKETDDLIHIKFNKNLLIENGQSTMLYNGGFFHNIAKIVNLNPDKKYATKRDHCEMFKENPKYYDMDTIKNILDKFGIKVSEERILELIGEENVIKKLIDENKDKIDLEKISSEIEKVSIKKEI